MLLLKPIGRGKWRTTTIEINDARALPMLLRPGQRFELGGITWRIVEVRT